MAALSNGAFSVIHVAAYRVLGAAVPSLRVDRVRVYPSKSSLDQTLICIQWWPPDAETQTTDFEFEKVTDEGRFVEGMARHEAENAAKHLLFRRAAYLTLQELGGP